jgi:hypothetical protein
MAKIKAGQTKSPKFDPTKNYQWNPEQEFVISGLQFDKLYKYAKFAYENPQSLPAAAKHEQFAILHELFIAGVEAGEIVEYTEPEDATKTLEAV